MRSANVFASCFFRAHFTYTEDAFSAHIPSPVCATLLLSVSYIEWSIEIILLHIYIYNTGFFKASTLICLIRSTNDPIKLLRFQNSLQFNLLLFTFSSITRFLFQLLLSIVYCGIVSYCSISAIQRSTSALFSIFIAKRLVYNQCNCSVALMEKKIYLFRTLWNDPSSSCFTKKR